MRRPPAVARYDVCIVGGSLAGGTLACALAAEGFSVALFERRRRSERKLCAELAARKLLERLSTITGADCTDAVSAELDRVVVVAGQRRLQREFTRGKGITVDRKVLESTLLGRAEALGASVWRSEAVERLMISDVVALVRSDRREISAEVVVGADGAASLVARRFSRPWRRDEVGATRHVRLTLPPSVLPDGPGAMRFDMLPEVGGYGWAVPYEDAIGIGAGGLSGPIATCLDGLLQRYETEAGVELTPLARGRVRGAPVPAAGPTRPTQGKRFLLVGDAAGFVSPASGEGMSLAVEGAVAAASALKLCFARGRFGSRATRHYEKLWRKQLPDFASLIRIRNTLSGKGALRALDDCENDLERLALLAPLVGPPESGQMAAAILARLESQRDEKSKVD